MDHLGHGEIGAVPHERLAHPFLLQRPNVIGQPFHQRPVVGDASEERHGGMSVGVDKARNQGMAAEGFLGRVRIFRPRLGDRQEVRNAPGGQGQGMVFENHSLRLHRNDPAGDQQGIYTHVT